MNLLGIHVSAGTRLWHLWRFEGQPNVLGDASYSGLKWRGGWPIDHGAYRVDDHNYSNQGLKNACSRNRIYILAKFVFFMSKFSAIITLT